MKTIAIRIFPLVFVCLLQSFSLCAQEPVSPETEYSRIRSLAFEGKLPEAETAALDLLDSFPSYGDAVVLLARIYAWQQKYEPAGILLDSLLKNEPLNYDALDAKLDLSLWNGDYPYAVSFADSILSSFPADSAIMEKKMRAIAAMELSVKTDSMDILPVSSADTIPAAPAEKPEPGKTDLRLGYNFDTFSEDYSRFWQVFQFGAGRTLPFGKVLGGINVGNLHSSADGGTRATELQFEVEAYPKISASDYAWLAYAFSPGRYFPGHRAAFEYWHSFKKGWVVSAGTNYYYFDRSIFIFGISGEKYYKTYWFSSKLYFHQKAKGVTTSMFFNARKYFNDTDYLQLTLGTGTAPDEPFDIELDLSRYSATTLRLIYNKSLTDVLSLRAGLGYSLEEYKESSFRNRYDGSINFIYTLRNRK